MIDRGDGKISQIDKETWDVQQEAIRNAVNAFYETFEKHDLDGAFWSLRLEVRNISMDFDSVLETQTWDDLQTRVEAK